MTTNLSEVMNMRSHNLWSIVAAASMLATTASAAEFHAIIQQYGDGIVTYRWKPSVSNRATLTGVTITRNRIGTGSNTCQETLTVTDGAGLKNSLIKVINFRKTD